MGLPYNFLHSHKAGVSFGLLLIYGLIIAYIGQSYKDRICNDVMLSYYDVQSEEEPFHQEYVPHICLASIEHYYAHPTHI
ncbi:TPA_asm: hypothetical protein G4W92_001290 [Salmonella enterica subsp. enterica serovar Abortusequi]|uniref:Uncharacterized protein n=1 Tax=Salmonella abortus-equi TaxID=607 RepID=A0A738B0I0_SALAE|nr:hypothetical protein [Salmonella enterica subsp. enterica serovar Abortusequi]QEY68238.1 hypothetical protein FXN66_13300 [Salmonella enterica subsp. enterica]HAA0791391.1 hypothetical protein [Salmonella enterica]HAE8731788.1 hypothetical protein [Salmonella enterica subsp. enterica serovar Abortusequi]